MTLILASGSPRRREILAEQGLSFDIFTADFDESSVSLENPADGVQKMALGKARAALEKWRGLREKAPFPLTEETVFLGADTIVVLDGAAMGKPKDEEDAFRMLKSLSAKAHQVYTGVALVSPQKEDFFVEKTEVFFKDLTDEEIRNYIATGEPMDKAGAYGIQGLGGALVDRIEGDYLNVVGLPAEKTLERLKFCN